MSEVGVLGGIRPCARVCFCPAIATVIMTLCSHRRKLCCLFYLVIFVSVTWLVSALFLLSNPPGFRSTDVILLGGTQPRSELKSPPEDNPITTQVGSPSKKSFAWNPDERYLAYLPHSGFHNQRHVSRSKTHSSFLVFSIERFLYRPHDSGMISSVIILSTTSNAS